MAPAEDVTLAAIDRVAQDVRDLRSDLTGRLDVLVTRREHDAEVRRLDSEHRALAEAHAALVISADQEHADIREVIDADRRERRMDRQRDVEARKADRQFFLTATFGGVGAAVALASLVVTIITRLA